MPRKSSPLFNLSCNDNVLPNKSLSFEDLSQKYANSVPSRRHRPMQVSRVSRAEAVECPENPRVRAAQLIFKFLLLNAWRKRRQEVENIRQQMKKNSELVKGKEEWDGSYIEIGDPHNEVKALQLLLNHEKEKLSLLQGENHSQGMVHLADQSIDNYTDGVNVTEYLVKGKRKDVLTQIQDESYKLQLRHNEIQQLEAQVKEIELTEENKLNGSQHDRTTTLNQFICKYLLKSLTFILLPNITK